MGLLMSKVRGQFIKRPLQRFNIEHRTEKLLKMEKPTPAPKYESDEKLLQKIRFENPEIFEEIKRKDSDLDKRLKQVFVKSFDPPNVFSNVNSKRPMPQKFSRLSQWKGFNTNPDRIVPKGKMSLTNIQELLTLHRKGPNGTPSQQLATQFNLDVRSVHKLVEYYSIFSLYKVRPDPNAKTRNDPYAAQPDWVEAGEEAKVIPIEPAPVNLDPKRTALQYPGVKAPQNINPKESP